MEHFSYILLVMIVPLGIALIFKYQLKKTYTWKELGINLGVVFALVTIIWFSGSMSQTADVEVWNGKILSKSRVQDSYVRSYSCNCRSVCSGSGKNQTCSTVCDTCYEDRYTVDWTARSTVGGITFKSLDSGSRSVYRTKDPAAYKKCSVGEPASKEHRYTNYVKAAPDSLFNTALDEDVYPIPAYPRVHSFYKVNRVLNVSTKLKSKDIATLDRLLSESLILLGAKKQVNIIVILTEIDDSSYRFSVENKWLGAKKNDVVVFLGLDGDTITWTDVMTWGLNRGNEVFQATLKSELSSIKTFNAQSIAEVVVNTTGSLYDRPMMKDYEYLKDDIQPPGWLLTTCFILSLLVSLGLTYFFHKNEV